jgi:hypothetical protein
MVVILFLQETSHCRHYLKEWNRLYELIEKQHHMGVFAVSTKKSTEAVPLSIRWDTLIDIFVDSDAKLAKGCKVKVDANELVLPSVVVQSGKKVLFRWTLGLPSKFVLPPTGPPSALWPDPIDIWTHCLLPGKSPVADRIRCGNPTTGEGWSSHNREKTTGQLGPGNISNRVTESSQVAMSARLSRVVPTVTGGVPLSSRRRGSVVGLPSLSAPSQSRVRANTILGVPPRSAVDISDLTAAAFATPGEPGSPPEAKYRSDPGSPPPVFGISVTDVSEYTSSSASARPETLRLSEDSDPGMLHGVGEPLDGAAEMRAKKRCDFFSGAFFDLVVVLSCALSPSSRSLTSILFSLLCPGSSTFSPLQVEPSPAKVSSRPFELQLGDQGTRRQADRNQDGEGRGKRFYCIFGVDYEA